MPAQEILCNLALVFGFFGSIWMMVSLSLWWEHRGHHYSGYLGYVWRHKVAVYKEGRKIGVGIFQLLIHDWSKLTPLEFIPAARKYNMKLDTEENNRAYDIAWLSHIHRNKHHWQYWIHHTDTEGVACLRMPERYVREMVADWRGVGIALGKGRENAVAWYLNCRDTLALHPQTRNRVETLLNVNVPDRYIQTSPFPTPRVAGS